MDSRFDDYKGSNQKGVVKSRVKVEAGKTAIYTLNISIYDLMTKQLGLLPFNLLETSLNIETIPGC